MRLRERGLGLGHRLAGRIRGLGNVERIVALKLADRNVRRRGFGTRRRCRLQSSRRGFRPRFGLGRSGRGLGRGVEAGGILALAQDQRDRGVDRNRLATGFDEDLAHRAVFDALDFHRRLVGFDFGEDRAGGDFVAFLDQPTCDLALGHGRREGGQQYGNRHGLRPPAERR